MDQVISGGSGLFAGDTICTDLRATSKDEAIREMIDLLYDAGVVTDKAVFTKVIYDREALSTTGIGFGIAIPHGKSAVVQSPRVAVGLARNGLDFASNDNELVYLVFMIAVPVEDESNLHLKILAALSRKLMHDDFRSALLASRTKAEILEQLNTIVPKP